MIGPAPTASLRIIHAGTTRLSERERKEIEDFISQPARPWFSQQERVALCRALAGEFAATSNDYFFLLSSDGRFVSHAWYPVSRRTPEIAVLGYVFTDSGWRGRGLSTFLLDRLWKHFVSRGGKVMYLGTGNPVARSIYLKHGFEDHNGHVMRRLAKIQAAKEFDDRCFEAGKKVSVRAAEWGDLACGTCLYTNPFPWVVRDFTEKIILRTGDELVRCVSIFVALMLRSEVPGNSMLVLEAAANRLVGCASIVFAPDIKKSVVEFLVHPNYALEATPFLQTLLKAGGGFICYAAQEDETKLAILGSLGFRKSERDRFPRGIVTLEAGSNDLILAPKVD